MEQADVAVVGAGPAGAVAAHLLARAGRSVQLLDPRLAGGAPLKPGDALSGAALRVLRASGLPLPSQNAAHRPIGGNISIWARAEPVHRDFLAEPDGPSWRLNRDQFEADLVGAARVAGVSTQAKAVRDSRREADRWILQVRNGEPVTVAWLVDATGRAALLARRFGARRQRDESLVAVVGYGRPDLGFTLERSLIETTPQGWWYAALLPDRRPVFMLHTRPTEAARLRAAPDQWQAALSATEHIASAFPHPALDGALRCYDACGASLTPVFGDRWIACGDAVLSFDPCSGQGIFSAMYTGMAAAHAVQTSLAGDNTALSIYAARCADIRQSYRQRICQHYSAERRWPTADFWHGLAGQREALSQ